MPGTVRYARDGRIGRITLDRPPLNVLDLAMFEALQRAIAEARADRRLAVLAVTGEGKVFSAGADVGDHTPDKVARMLELFHGAVRALLALEVPVVALAHGAALGGGAELALACDIILARDDLKFGFPEIQLAAFPPVAAALLPRVVGRHAALDLILTGRTLDADGAARIGLVSRVFPSPEFETGTTKVLAGLAGLSAPVLRLAKRAVREGEEVPFDGALERAERIYLDDLMREPDAHEGIAAFLAKRSPAWREPS